MYRTSMPDSTSSLPARLRALWSRVPFRHMTALVIALFVIKEQFPFSNFPMYSNFDTEADVIFVTDQNDQPLPMDRVFKTGSAATKKTWKGEVALLVNPGKRDTNDATAAERAEAGRTVLAALVKRMRAKEIPAGTTSLRLYLRTFALDGDVFIDSAPDRLAEQSL